MAYIDKYRWDATLLASTTLNTNEGDHDSERDP
jgi:hypothetical protein